MLHMFEVLANAYAVLAKFFIIMNHEVLLFRSVNLLQFS